MNAQYLMLALFFLLITLLHVLMRKHHQGVSLYTTVSKSIKVNARYTQFQDKILY